jgi:hypothetical protein
MYLETLNIPKFYEVDQVIQTIAKLSSTENIWIAGGCFRSILDGEAPNDYVVYSDKPHLILTSLTPETENDSVNNFRVGNKKVQVVMQPYESPSKVLDMCDFTICKMAAIKGLFGIDYRYHPDFWEDYALRQLKVPNLSLENAASVFNRAFKYTARGFTLPPVERMRLAQSLQGADLTACATYTDGNERKYNFEVTND